MDSWGIENQKIVQAYINKLSAIYDRAIKQGVNIGYSVTNINTDKPFSFSDYPGAKKKADNLFSKVAYEIQSLISGGAESAWLLSGQKNDALVEKVFKNSGLTKEQLSGYFDRNLDALGSFQNRVDGGMKLSDRVWNYTDQFKNEIELSIGVGIGDGRSANELSQDVRQYLNNPDKLFRRVRDEHGELQLSKAAKAYHPGQGVYRSSYKNAVRLARTEINMSYHVADNERWSQFDFVSGYEVVLSNGHPQEDICDVLQGVYPKTFVFWGWHAQCLCHTIPILSPQQEFASQIAKMLKGEDTSGYVPSNLVTDLPSNFKQWAIDNESRMQNAKSLPYFIKNNFKGVDVSKWFGSAAKQAENVPVYSESRLSNALNFDNVQNADDYFREKCGQLWNKITDDQKDSLFYYTSGSGAFNRPLRGYDGNWNNFKGVGNVPFDNEVTGIDMKRAYKDLSTAISKSKLKADTWLFRGTDYQSLDGMFNINIQDYIDDKTKDIKELIGKKGVDEAFLSTTSMNGSNYGFNGAVKIEVFAPKGSEAMYCEPFSDFGNGAGRSWDGASKQNTFGSEFETIINRGYEYQIIDIERVGNYDFKVKVQLLSRNKRVIK